MDLITRIRFGLVFAVALAGAFSLLAGVVCFSKGPATFERDLGISCGRTVLLYFTTLPISGIIGGVFGRLFHNLIGTFVLGSILAFVPFLGFGLTMWSGSLREVVLTAAGFSVAIGGSGFLIGRFRTRPRRHWWSDSPSGDAA